MLAVNRSHFFERVSELRISASLPVHESRWRVIGKSGSDATGDCAASRRRDGRARVGSIAGPVRVAVSGVR